MMPGEAIKVLLIEDNPADAQLIREYLRASNGVRFQLAHCDRLQAGLAWLADHPTDVVLLDLSLPDSHGIETFQSVHTSAPRVPVILLTHLVDEELAIRMVQEGAQDYLLKNQVGSALLTRAIRYAIGRRQADEQLALYAEELRTRNAELVEDFSLAREVQIALLPRTYPTFPPYVAPAQSVLRFHHLYRPSALTGGDFFSIFPISEMRAGLFICDVMGHGMRAALVTAIIRGVIEEVKEVAYDPGLFLTEINRSVSAILCSPDVAMFATAAYLVLDAGAGLLRYTLAGHPPPLHMHRAEGRLDRLEHPPGQAQPALGLDAGALYTAEQHPLAAGDLVLAYTDGIYEVTAPTGEQFGLERLETLLQAHLHHPLSQLLPELLAGVIAFGGGEAGEDDICLVAAEWVRP